MRKPIYIYTIITKQNRKVDILASEYNLFAVRPSARSVRPATSYSY